MTKTDVVELLGPQVTEAWHELIMSRLDYEHSPHADSKLTMIQAEARLNLLLDRLFGKLTPAQVAEADARPIRPVDVPAY